MKYPIDKDYYIVRKPEQFKRFEAEVKIWMPVVLRQYGEIPAYRILLEARQSLENLIPQIPYIGGDENPGTNWLLASVRCLALYQAMKKQGKTSEETGKILYDAILTRVGEPPPDIPPAEKMTTEELDKRLIKDAERSQERRYPGDFVYTYIAGDGNKYDRGYDFTECAVLKFYHAQDADEFTPFYCYLDFPKSKVNGSGLTRTMTMSEGYKKCNHRDKAGRETKVEWPPPFLKRGLNK
jgi:hypothetical protein